MSKEWWRGVRKVQIKTEVFKRYIFKPAKDWGMYVQTLIAHLLVIPKTRFLSFVFSVLIDCM